MKPQPTPSFDLTKETNYWLGKVIHLLNSYPKTLSQLEVYLNQKINSENKSELVKSVLQIIKQKNLVNDSEYGDSYIQSCISSGKGPKYISLKLRSKGINSSIISQGLAQIDPEIWKTSIEIIAKKKLKSNPLINQNQLIRFLIGRGFDYSLINSVIDDLLS